MHGSQKCAKNKSELKSSKVITRFLQVTIKYNKLSNFCYKYSYGLNLFRCIVLMKLRVLGWAKWAPIAIDEL